MTFEKVSSSQTGVNPRATAGFFSYLSFNWLNDLLQLGNARPLEADDLYPLLPEHESEQLTYTLERAWKLECKRAKHTSPSLLKTLLSITNFTEWLVVMSLVLFRSIGNVLLPFFVGLLLATLEENIPANNYQLYVYGLSISLCAFGVGVLMQLSEYMSSVIGLKVRAAITGLLFQKVLRMQDKGCYDTEQKNVLNLVGNDVNRFNMAITYLPSILLAPLEIALVVATIAWFVGWPTLLGALAIPLFVAIQLYCARSTARLREKSTSFADKRVAHS